MSELFTPIQRDKLHSRLRVIANGNSEVNAIRAEHIGGLRVRTRKALRSLELEQKRSPCDRARGMKEAPSAVRRAGKGKQTTLPKDIEANVFVTLNSEDSRPRELARAPKRGRILTARIPLDQLPRLLADAQIAQVEVAESIRAPFPLEGESLEKFPAGASREGVPGARRHKHGEGLLVGIVDVGGFDFSHPDFVLKGATRFERIWDQGGRWRKAPGRKPSTNYGSEIHRDHMNAALKAAPRIGVAATELEPQSQMTPSSHGTHVASIAAGNHSDLKNAMLAGVLVELPPEDQDRRLSFYDTTRIAHAVDYLIALKEELGAKALVINISLGTNGGGHDGSEPMSRWLDSCLTQPGHAICVAAGNSGQERPMHESDLGFVTGRIHTEGRIEAAHLERDLEWIVVGNGIADISENELEIWYSAQDRFEVWLRPPGWTEWLPPIGPGQYIENKVLSDTKTVVSIYNDLYNPHNGDNKVSIYLSPFMNREGVIGVAAGRWTVKLVGKDVRDGRYHGWIERDDPRPLHRGTDRQYWQFPSFFHGKTNVDRASVSSLACGPRVIGVANLDAERRQINISSSQGPTRDGRHKPDVAAPGTEIPAANGFYPEQPWVRKTGTSMASPYVAGVVGLMLSANPALTAAQVGGIIQRTARPLPGANYQWRDDAGYGVIDPRACVDEAIHAHDRKDVTR